MWRTFFGGIIRAMGNRIEKLDRFFEETKTLSFWKRVFSWSPFRALSFEAYEEFKALASQVDRLVGEFEAAKQAKSILENTNEHLQTSGRQQNADLAAVRERVGHFEQENRRLRDENIAFKQTDDVRRRSYEENVAGLNAIKEQIQNDRQRELAERQQAEAARMVQQSESWATHEARVREAIKGICQKHTIDYVEKVPFKGTPDNTIRLCDEFIVFDAKSPGSLDDLGNFPTYIKTQTELVRKYVKEENVKREIYFVIPSNTAEVLDTTAFNMADYSVYVVTLDALEPLILALQKLEEYEFVDQLSPEERDNVCRAIGRFAHMTKRRIQIDLFFNRLFLEALSKCESELPGDILEKAVEYEKAEKLNPPQEKRSKSIPNKSLELDSQQVKREAEAKGIAFPSTMQTEIASLPLHANNKSDPATK